MFEPTARLGRIAILWRGDEAARRSFAEKPARRHAVASAIAAALMRVMVFPFAFSPF